MLSDEEKILIKKLSYCEQEYEQNGYLSVGKFEAIKEAVNLIEKQSKEIAELKEEKYGLEEEVQIQAKQLIEIDGNYISKEESEQKEKQAYIDGTNAADKLCNKKWKDKIKAKIEEYQKQIEKMEKDDVGIGFTLGKEWSDLKAKIEFGQSLLEKE